MAGFEQCGTCQGSGDMDCPGCEGTGKVKGVLFLKRKCSDCDGRGTVLCETCREIAAKAEIERPQPDYAVILTPLDEETVGPDDVLESITLSIVSPRCTEARRLLFGPEMVAIRDLIRIRMLAGELTCRVATETPEPALSDKSFHKAVLKDLFTDFEPEKYKIRTYERKMTERKETVLLAYRK